MLHLDPTCLSVTSATQDNGYLGTTGSQAIATPGSDQDQFQKEEFKSSDCSRCGKIRRGGRANFDDGKRSNQAVWSSTTRTIWAETIVQLVIGVDARVMKTVGLTARFGS